MTAALRLSEAFPLRTTRMLGNFAVDEPLPLRFGDLRNTRVALVKLNDSEWFAADHVMDITAVYIDDEATVGYDVQRRTDAAGNTWTVVRLAAPAAPEASVSASGTGLLNAHSGALYENPADIAEYLLRRAGRSEIFPQWRSEASADDIRLAGSIDSARTIRAWIDELAYSSGAIWTPSLARLYPTTTVTGPVYDLDVESAGQISVTESLDDTADVLRLGYDWNEATQRAQQYVELTSSPQRFGGFVAERTLPWLRLAANAESIGTRILQRMAGKRYSVTFATDQVARRPCEWTRFVAHPQWPIAGADPVPMILSVDARPGERTLSAAAEWIASVPAVRLTAHTIALPDTRSGAVEVSIADGVATFGVTDDHGQPIHDALVSLDGGAAKKTDEQGHVSFSITPATPPRKHQLAIEAPGMTPFLLDVYL